MKTRTLCVAAPGHFEREMHNPLEHRHRPVAVMAHVHSAATLLADGLKRGSATDQVAGGRSGFFATKNLLPDHTEAAMLSWLWLLYDLCHWIIFGVRDTCH
jgi:hypothetical protein